MDVIAAQAAIHVWFPCRKWSSACAGMTALKVTWR